MALKIFDHAQHIGEVFASDGDLPSVVNLGLYVFIDGAWAHCPDHTKLTTEQFQQILLKLHAQTHVTVLNLGGCCVGNTPGPVMCERIAAALMRPTNLRVLQLGGEWLLR
jgi:hypothetical protein